MNTAELIDELSQTVEPVEPLRPPIMRLAMWLAAAFLCVGTGIGMMGLRHDLAEISSNPHFLFETLLILLAAISSAGAAFVLSIPGAANRATRVLPLVAISLWLVWLSTAFVQTSGNPFEKFVVSSSGAPCFFSLLAMGAVPGLLLFLLIRKAAPLGKSSAGLFASAGAIALAAFGLQFTCAGSDPAHLLVWHFLPVIAVAFVGMLLGRQFLNWDSQLSASK